MKKIVIFLICVFFAVGVFAAELCITIPDAKVTRVQDGVCGQYSYDPNTDGTKNAFIKAKVRQFLRDTVLAYEYEQSKEAISLEALSMEE